MFASSALSTRRGRRIDKFWVITCYFNPLRYESRFKNYQLFAQGLQRQGVNLLTVEMAPPGETQLKPDQSTRYVHVEARDVLWAKERLLNVAVAELPPECTQVCWCDCDILFARPDWAAACSRLLDAHPVVQPFQTAIFMGPNEMPSNHNAAYAPLESFVSFFCRTGRTTLIDSKEVFKAHPGYVWAARRAELTRMGLFFDKCILGHADMVMGLAFCHDPDRFGGILTSWDAHWDPGWSPMLKAEARAWQRRASEVVRGNVGFVPGKIYHLYHGSNKSRNYTDRGKLLQAFDPAVHLAEDPRSGMWVWTSAAKLDGLDEAARRYFAARCEDR
jgi:hypothetical protein